MVKPEHIVKTLELIEQSAQRYQPYVKIEVSNAARIQKDYKDKQFTYINTDIHLTITKEMKSKILLERKISVYNNNSPTHSNKI